MGSLTYCETHTGCKAVLIHLSPSTNSSDFSQIFHFWRKGAKGKMSVRPGEEKPKSSLGLVWIAAIGLSLAILASLLGEKEQTTTNSASHPPHLPPLPPLPLSSLEELQGLVDGELLLPGQQQYEKRRQVCASQPIPIAQA